MILLRISSLNEEIIESVASILLKENWAVDINLKKNVKRLDYKENQVVEESLYIFFFKILTYSVSGMLRIFSSGFCC